MYLQKEDLKTHMTAGDIDVISGNDDTIVVAAIDGAISEAKGYLSAYDVNSIFGASGSSRNSLLLTFVKDIAIWHLVVLSNYQADVSLREKRYDRAVSWLKSVQKGDVVPDLPSTNNETMGKISFSSNQRRNNHF